MYEVTIPTLELVAGDKVVWSGTARGYADVIAVTHDYHYVTNEYLGTRFVFSEVADSGRVFTYEQPWHYDEIRVYRDAPTVAPTNDLGAMVAQVTWCSCSACSSTRLAAETFVGTYESAVPMFTAYEPWSLSKLELLTECIGENFPAALTESFLALHDAGWRERNRALRDAWGAWCTAYNYPDMSEFCEFVERATDDAAQFCECGNLCWRDDMTFIDCESEYYCESCACDYSWCKDCECYTRETTRVEYDHNVCESCLQSYNYCETCECYYGEYDDSHDHEDSCDCCAPVRQFAFPANGHGTIREDERLRVDLPAGVIDERGMQRIKSLLEDKIQLPNTRGEFVTSLSWYDVSKLVDDIGPIWQTKRGNFTRRLSAAVHKLGGKLADGILSEVGNIAREHSSKSAAWNVEVTRDLNLSAADFVHEDSCWWGGYWRSRCALKQWGGLALRTFADADAPTYPYRDRDEPTGRVWVLPLGADLMPTHDALNARAYVVFNAYGDISGYAAARVVAHLSDRTYRKISFSADLSEGDGMYVNNGTGYLVADEATCNAVDGLSFDDMSYHDHTDSRAVLAAVRGALV